MKLTTKNLDDYYNQFIIIDIIELIAWRLAHIFRFAGESPISVALHSLLVTELVSQDIDDPRSNIYLGWASMLMAIMHDSDESCTSDIPSPVCDYLNHNYDGAIDHLKSQLRKYLYNRCFPSRIVRIPSAEIQNAAQELIAKADEKARKCEAEWLEKYGYELRKARTTNDTNVLIEILIKRTLKYKTRGVFANVRDADDGNVAYDWQCPRAVKTLWEDSVRILVNNLEIMERKDLH